LHSDARFGTSEFIGLDNYIRAFTGSGSEAFWQAFWFTTQLTVVTMFFELVIGFGMALIMNKAFKGRGLVRASVLVPWAIPTAVAARLWEWNFQPDGVVNQVFGTDIIWTAGHWSSFWAIVIADVWKTAPFIALLVLAGLQIIPDEVYEAAKVDGATAIQSFRRITLPLVKSAVIVAVLFRMLDVLRIFDLPFILTNGANQTETLSTLSYKESIQQLHPSYGSTLSTITFVYIILAAFLVNSLARADVVKASGGR
jgi:multiple sugar transport system permease protein